MRIALVIVCLTAIGLATVVCRQREVAAGREIHRLQRRLIEQRRALWDLEARLAEVCALAAVRIRAQDMHTVMVPPEARDSESRYAMTVDAADDRAGGSWRGGTVERR